jgi:hypothetical protein
MVRDALENACHVTVVLNKVDLVNPKYKVRHDPLLSIDCRKRKRRVCGRGGIWTKQCVCGMCVGAAAGDGDADDGYD